MTHNQFNAVAAMANKIASRSTVSKGYAADMREVAMDCQGAMDGCDVALANVLEWIERDDELALVAENAA